jgi:hypothetical protein
MPTLAKSASTIVAPDALTPHLTLAIALLYVASSESAALEAQRRQFLTVLGEDEAVLRLAATYVQSVAIEQFLQAAPRLLSTQEKLCVLVNVCDVLLTTSPSDPVKLVLFERMLQAFGLSTDAFAPYYKTLVLKHDSLVLGAYDAQASTSEHLSAHVALATSILYMMAAGGAIAAENMAQLHALIGEFKGLQGVALTYIRRVKFNQFLPQASARLTGPQKLYILVHACDSLLLDGRIEDLERQMFQAMLSAFGYSERSFRPYFHTLEIKNAKPVDELPGAVPPLAKGAKKTRTFETRSIQVGDKTKALVGSDASEPHPSALLEAPSGRDGGAVVSRTMHNNVQEVREDLVGDANVAYINPNANQDANIQRIGQDQSALNRQTLEAQGLPLNRQTVASDAVAINRQAVTSMPSPATNQQRLDADGSPVDNRQPVGVDRFDDQRVLISDEERLKDLDFIIDNLQRKIDQFERKNKTVLREATQAKLSHPPSATDEMTQISTPHHPRAVATSHLQVEKAAERILDLHDEARDWNVIWITATVAIIFFTCVMSVRIVWG